MLATHLALAMVDAVEAKTSGLNTPKHENLKPLFDKVLGIPDVGCAWVNGATLLDEFVKRRGEVAHRGRQAKYVRFAELKKAVSVVSGYVVETDNFLSDYLRPLVTPARRPWNRV